MDKIINKNIDKIKEKNPVKNFTANYNFTNDDDDDRYISYINEGMDDIDISDLFEQDYKFNNDENILDSFQKVYDEYNIKYEPRDDTKFIRVRYLLKKLKDNNEVNTSLYNHFRTSLSEKIDYIMKSQLIKKKNKQESSKV